MKRFIDDLNYRADELAGNIASAPASQTFVLGGRWGSGKSSLLHALKPRLLELGLKPIVVSPPQRDMDTGPAALLQIADSLQAHGLANGELGMLEAPDAAWSVKMATTLRCIERNKKIVVFLCEEPGIWMVPPTADETFSPYSNQHIQDVVAAIQDRAPCRRVFTSSWFQRNEGFRRYDLPWDSHPSWLLGDGQDWADMASVAHELHSRLGANLGVATPLEIRLLVALAAATSVTDVVGYYLSQWPDCQAITRRLASSVAANSEYGRLRTLWAQLALCREFVDQALLDWLDVRSLGPHERTLLYHGLLHRREDGYELNHVLRFQETVVSWLDSESRIATHRKFAAYYRAKIDRDRSTIQNSLELEGYHHASLAPVMDTPIPFRVLFVDQLNKLGKTYSKEYRNFATAAEVFREAIRWDDQNDYGHHYLAYNIDWLANDRTLVESEYRRAIELNPQHPWWWSRWINFLITVGRSRDAREQWKRAVDALGLANGEAAATVYQSLHLCVARLLVHRAQLDFADTVLSETPASLRATDTRFQAINDVLTAMREATRARAVFPLSVSPKDWWNGPHLEFDPSNDNGPLVKWFPAQVDEVDEKIVYLIMAKRGPGDGRVEYGHVEMQRKRFDDASLDERSEQLRAGRFLELAFYGAEEALKIRVHPDGPWQPSGLPGLDPDPRRYLRMAGIAT